jgi:general secretion pathway protein M
MTPMDATTRTLMRYPAIAVAAYAGVVLSLLWAAGLAIADIGERRSEVAAADDMLARLEGRASAKPDETVRATLPMPTGSPFLEGQTVTVAGAALFQRVSSAVTQLGGNVLSSQVEIESVQGREGFIAVTASCEIDQQALQKLLYDLEAGMPYLFIDQLVAQAAAPGAEHGGEHMRVLLEVSGLWGGTK